jgi:apolipoprotein N-acyltransferase
MFQKLYRNKAIISALAGIFVFLAFPQFEVLPFIILFPVFFNFLILACESTQESFWYGFLSSFFVMLGGFYWVIYVIHEFGYLPWAVSVLLYIGFCGFGALNFPLFSLAAFWLQRKLDILRMKSFHVELWYALGLPLLFTIIEWLIPKLFPWYVGHCLYQSRWANRIVEITGSEFLTLCIYSLGSVLGMLCLRKRFANPPRIRAVAIPMALWAVCLGFSFYANRLPPPPSKTMKIALVQANIGSLERMDAAQGLIDRIEYVVEKHRKLTESVLPLKPDLILWPEAAMPFDLKSGARFAKQVRGFAKAWKTTMIVGAFSVEFDQITHDYNAAYLLEPKEDGTLRIETYFKNILLAFGEYFPFGEEFPILYRWFPQVSNFTRGKKQEPFILKDGTRLGISICYEAIVPSFVRKVAQHHIQALVNLTNDSWFGPTSETYLHGALTVFRALELRVPLLRVTNTGTSFTVDQTGVISKQTPTFQDTVTVVDMAIPTTPPETVYLRFGRWYGYIYLAGLACLLMLLFWKRYAPLPI